MNIKKTTIIFLLCTPLICFAQTNKQKLSKDSVRYYQKELGELWKATYDSFLLSEKYKEINQKLDLDKRNRNERFGIEMTFFTGFQGNSYTNLNARLKSLGIKEVKTSLAPVGIGLSFRFNKVIIGYDMSGLVGDISSGAYGNGYLSTNILKIKRWIFSPQIGFGGQNIIVRIPTQSSSNNFDSYFTTAANQVEINHKNTFLDFALAFKLQSKSKDMYAPLFRMGYRHGLSEKSWEVKNGVSNNAPTDRNSNYYIQLRIGFGN